jgi:hypothetical protein
VPWLLPHSSVRGMIPSSLAAAENSGDMPYRVLGSTDISFRQY